MPPKITLGTQSEATDFRNIPSFILALWEAGAKIMF